MRVPFSHAKLNSLAVIIYHELGLHGSLKVYTMYRIVEIKSVTYHNNIYTQFRNSQVGERWLTQ